MFSRLQKGFTLDFLDNKIAEEQEKAKQQQQAQKSGGSQAKRTPSGAARRGRGTNEAPGKRGDSSLRVPEGIGRSPAKGPDPDDFVIGDDESATSASRTATPQPVKEGEEESPGKQQEEDVSAKTISEKGKEQEKDAANMGELPLDVQQRLRKLETLTARYQDLLRNYRSAHHRVATIEPFEATLREHTSLTSIDDPGALVEFLNQRELQNQMVMGELKRISEEHRSATKERDELKAKLEDAERRAREAFDEAAGLRKERDSSSAAPTPKDPEEPDKDTSVAESKSGGANDGDALFSYEEEVSKSSSDDKTQDSLVEELRVELSGRDGKIEELTKGYNEVSAELASARQDLDIMRSDSEQIRLDLDTQKDKIRQSEAQTAEHQHELTEARTQLQEACAARDSAKEQEHQATKSLEKVDTDLIELQKRLKQAQEDLKEGNHSQSDGKREQILQNMVASLRKDLESAENKTRAAEANVEDRKSTIKILESQANTAASIIGGLRTKEAALQSLEKKLAQAEEERDAAQRQFNTKKGHEAAVASLSTQLKQALRERDKAYQTIIDCRKCKGEKGVDTPSEETTGSPARSRMGSGTTDISTIPTEVSESTTPATPSVDGNEIAGLAAAKKKSKKKSKSKKAKNEITLDDLIRDPTKGPEVLLRSNFGDNPIIPLFTDMYEHMKGRNENTSTQSDDLVQHLESKIEELEGKINDHVFQIKCKDEDLVQAREELARLEKLREDVDDAGERNKINIEKNEAFSERLRSQAELETQIEELKEEKDDLQDSMIELGKAATDAKDALKQMKERRDKLQEEYEELHAESESFRKQARDAAAQSEILLTHNKELQAELAEHKTKAVSSEEVERLQGEVRAIEAERSSLQVAKEASEKQVASLQTQQTTRGAEQDEKNRALIAECDTLKARVAELDKELAAANSLAQKRFKDLSDVRELYNKSQSELKRLREESTELKTVKADLEKFSAAVKKLEAKEKDFRSEITEHKSQSARKDAEISSLRDKTKKSDDKGTILEESYETARRDLEKSESARNEAIEGREKAQAGLKKVEDDLQKARSASENLEKQVKKFTAEAQNLRDELDMKSASQASAQSYMDSMRDETRELATQMKELKEQKESSEEELADAQRLLSERSREAETMRRMLAEVEGRADARVKEMREQMDLAVQERDRAEDEASAIGRRRAREIEDLKIRLRDLEREAARASEARHDAERKDRDFRDRQMELERTAAQRQEELTEIRAAMAQIRDTLDATERHNRQLEKERNDSRKQKDELDIRLDKLQKSSKAMAEELRAAQATTTHTKRPNPTAAVQQSSRNSRDSSRVTSPAPRTSKDGPLSVDVGYLKNVLLQFMNQKETKFKLQLVPVLGQLLDFDRQDEEKWMAAVTAK